jgi:MATE family multidrug resistance protein
MLTYAQHYKKITLLALPVCISNLGYMLVGIVDTIMVGKINEHFAGYNGTEAQAAVALANSLYNLVLVFGIGISFGITPLIAEADARKDFKAKAELLKNSLYLNLSVNTILFIALLFSSPLLHHLNQPEKVVQLAIPFLNVMMFGMIPLSVFFTFKQFTEGLSLTVAAMVISFIGNFLNILLNYVFIFGHWGMEPMGLQGSCWASFVSRVLMALLFFLYVRYHKRFTPYWTQMRTTTLNKAALNKIGKIGFSSALQWTFEVGAFNCAIVMMGWLGEVPQAAHQIAISVAATTYMIASGFSGAASVRVGNEVGNNNKPEIRRAAFSAFHIVGTIMVICAICFALLNKSIASYFSADEAVIATAASLILIAAFFQLFDGLQAVALGVLRGITDTKVPTIVTLIAYWVIGLPVSYLLAFKFNLGAQGVWYGLTLSLVIVCIALISRFHLLTKS